MLETHSFGTPFTAVLDASSKSSSMLGGLVFTLAQLVSELAASLPHAATGSR